MKNKGERHAIGSFAGHSHLSQAVLQSPRCNMDKRTRDSFLLHFFPHPVEKAMKRESSLEYGVCQCHHRVEKGDGHVTLSPFRLNSPNFLADLMMDR